MASKTKEEIYTQDGEIKRLLEGEELQAFLDFRAAEKVKVEQQKSKAQTRLDILAKLGLLPEEIEALGLWQTTKKKNRFIFVFIVGPILLNHKKEKNGKFVLFECWSPGSDS